MSATIIAFKPKPKSTDEADAPRRWTIAGSFGTPWLR
jgi:hypothetical protein